MSSPMEVSLLNPSESIQVGEPEGAPDPSPSLIPAPHDKVLVSGDAIACSLLFVFSWPWILGILGFFVFGCSWGLLELFEYCSSWGCPHRRGKVIPFVLNCCSDFLFVCDNSWNRCRIEKYIYFLIIYVFVESFCCCNAVLIHPKFD